MSQNHEELPFDIVDLGNAIAGLIGAAVSKLSPDGQVDFARLVSDGADVVTTVHTAPIRIRLEIEHKGHRVELLEIVPPVGVQGGSAATH